MPSNCLGENDVLVTWGTPQGYMETPWYNILLWSCLYAHGSSNLGGLQVALTEGMFNHFNYDPGDSGHAVMDGDEPENEEFYPREFLEDPTGKCNDFADFLTLSMQSLGASLPTPTRSYPLETGPWWIQTNSYLKAGQGIPNTSVFRWHQFVTTSTTVWDGAIRYESTPNNWISPCAVELDDYELILVAYYLDELDQQTLPPSSPPWDPTPVQLTLSATVR